MFSLFCNFWHFFLFCRKNKFYNFQISLTRRREVISLRRRTLFTGHDKKQQKDGLFFFIAAKSNFKTKGKVIHMCIICAPICMRAWKKAFFLHVWLSKVLLLEITLANKTKNNFKKNFFFLVWTAKQCQQKKKKMLGLSLPLFQNKSKNNRSPALAFVFSNKQPKSCFVYKWETFFFFAFFIYQKTKLPTDKLFFFVNKTILKWETETK